MIEVLLLISLGIQIATFGVLIAAFIGMAY